MFPPELVSASTYGAAATLLLALAPIALKPLLTGEPLRTPSGKPHSPGPR